MTDKIDCSNCGGTGVDPASIPSLLLQCGFCGGRGWVGGEHEPAEAGELSEDVDPMNATPAWDEPGWTPAGCQTCGGSGEVISMGGAIRPGQARLGVRAPCPACQARRAG